MRHDGQNYENKAHVVMKTNDPVELHADSHMSTNVTSERFT